MEEVEDSSKGSNKDLYTGSQIFRRPPPTVSNEKQLCKEWTSNLMDWKKSQLKKQRNQICQKPILEDWLLQISSLYSMTNPLLWFQKMSSDEKERFNPILILVQFKLPKNELAAYQESIFSVASNNMSNFQTKMKYDLLERHTPMHQNYDFVHKHVFNN